MKLNVVKLIACFSSGMVSLLAAAWAFVFVYMARFGQATLFEPVEIILYAEIAVSSFLVIYGLAGFIITVWRH